MKLYREYYAAANGFSGFRSYFDEVFYHNAISGIFILKGGPGTGKSTLMRKILEFFSKNEYKCDAIFCSSDTASLDGVIIDGRVAVIDGTAPHEMDTKLPGALDEIINLGNGWNTEKLKSSRASIEESNKNKKQNYFSAYKYLAFSGNIHNYKLKLIQNHFDFNAAEKLISNLIQSYKKSEKKPKRVLISSFSKDGYTRREHLGFDIKKLYSIKGMHGESEIFLDILKRLVSGKFQITLFPSPLSDSITEGVYFEDEKILFLDSAQDGEEINASAFLKGNVDEEIDFLNKYEEIYLEKSKLFFKKASEFHFLLEDIYTTAMNFENNGEIFQNLCERIEKILSY